MKLFALSLLPLIIATVSASWTGNNFYETPKTSYSSKTPSVQPWNNWRAPATPTRPVYSQRSSSYRYQPTRRPASVYYRRPSYSSYRPHYPRPTAMPIYQPRPVPYTAYRASSTARPWSAPTPTPTYRKAVHFSYRPRPIRRHITYRPRAAARPWYPRRHTTRRPNYRPRAIRYRPRRRPVTRVASRSWSRSR